VKRGVRVEVEFLGEGRIRVTSPDAPQQVRVARNVPDLGVAVRDIAGYVLTRRGHAHPAPGRVRVPKPLEVDPEQVDKLEDLVCRDCGRTWNRIRRLGRKPVSCDPCYAARGLYRPTTEVVVAA
jgi:hypothetical protein